MSDRRVTAGSAADLRASDPPDRVERRRVACPRLIVVCGVPASGKSTLAGALARVTGLPVVSSRTARAGAALDLAQRDPSRYSAAVYTRLGRLAAIAVARHHGAIVDATFRRATDRPAFARGLGPCPAHALFVECRTPSDVLDDRAAQRARQGDPVDPDRYSFAPLDDIAPSRRLAVNSERPVSVLTDLVNERCRPGGLPANAVAPPRST